MHNDKVTHYDLNQQKGVPKKLLAALMSIVLVVGLVPSAALAQAAYAAGTGSAGADTDATVGTQAVVEVTLEGNGGTFAVPASADIWDGATYKMPDPDADGVYQITSAAELAGFRAYVNGESANLEQATSKHLDANAALMVDVDWGGNEWVPIGYTVDMGTDNSYSGTFDGNGHTVTINDETTISTYLYWGFFGSMSGTVKNLTLEGSLSVTSSKYRAYVGGFIGLSYGATVTGCINKMDIEVYTSNPTGTGTSAPAITTAGIIGYSYGAIVANCGNEGSISATNSNTTHSVWAAGIVGSRFSNGNYIDCIENCYNWGDITVLGTGCASSSRVIAAGIIAHSYAAYSNTTRYFVNCYNAGNIQASLSSANASTNYVYKASLFGNLSNVKSGNPVYVYNCFWADASLDPVGLVASGTGTSSSTTYYYTQEGYEAYTDATGLMASLQTRTTSPTNSGVLYDEWVASTDPDHEGLPCFESKSQAGTVSVGSIKLTTDANGVIVASDYQDPARNGWELVGWTENEDGSGASYTTDELLSHNFAADTTLYAQWKALEYNITVVTDEDQGKVKVTVNDEEVTEVATGAEVTVTLEPAEGYELSSLILNGETVTVTNNTYTFEMPASNVILTANWVLATYTVSVDPNIVGGTVTVSKSSSSTGTEITATMGTTITVTVVPKDKYAIGTVYYTRADNDEQTTIEAVDGTYTFDMPASDVTVSVEFTQVNFNVTLDGNGGMFGEGRTTSTWDGTSYDEPSIITVDSVEYYEITSAAELAWFVAWVNGTGEASGSTTTHYNAYAMLACDIDWGTYLWTPIAKDGFEDNGSGYAYTGTFDGAGYTITINSSYSAGSSNDANYGFFNGLAGTVRNLTLEGSLSATGYTVHMGALAECTYYATVTNFINRMTLTATTTTSGYYNSHLGGLAGEDYGSTFVNCGNEGDMTITDTRSSAWVVYAGGFIGTEWNGGLNIENCYNWGDFTCSGYSSVYVGGIFGLFSQGSGACYFVNFYSSGAITISSGNSTIGGLVGSYSDSSSRPGYFINCHWANSRYSKPSGTYITCENTDAYTSEDALLAELRSVTESPAGASGLAYNRWYSCTSSAHAGLPCFEYQEMTWPSPTLPLLTEDDGTLTASEYMDPVREGKELVGWSFDPYGVNGVFSTEELLEYPFTEDTIVYAIWDDATYAIDVVVEEGSGTVSITVGGNEDTGAKARQTVVLTPQPAEGYEFESLTVEGEEVTLASDGTYTFEMPEKDVSVVVRFTAIPYTITVGSDTGGSVTVAIEGTEVTTETIEATVGQNITLTPVAVAGYELNELTVDDDPVTLDSDGTYTFSMPAAPVEVKATWTAIPYAITVTSPEDQGSVTVTVDNTEVTTNPMATVGQDVTLTPAAQPGYELAELTVDGDTVELTDGTYTFTMPAAPVEVEATWTAIPYTITVSSDAAYGSITVAVDGTEATTDPITATVGQSITLTPDAVAGYEPDTVTVNDEALAPDADGIYTFTMPADDVRIVVTWKLATYTITVENDAAQGSVTVTVDGTQATTATFGQIVTVTFRPTLQYEFGSLTVNGVEVDVAEDGTYTFTMPTTDVTLSVTWKEIPITTITENMFIVDTSSETYTASPIEKTIASPLVEGVDYEVSYADNVNVGTATITITGIAPNYGGELTYTFDIIRAFTRLAGDDRYGTMEAADDEGFESADTVVLTTGSNFPDALAAAGLAGTLSAPIILTATDELSAEAAEEIARLGATNVIIVGGENSVSANVASALESSGLSVERVAGDDRYETALDVYYATEDAWGTSGNGTAKTAIIASGTSFPDTLSASSYSWWATAPIFLASADGIDDATKAAIETGGFDRIIIVGGVNSVPNSVEVWAYEVATTKRLSGDDRYVTSVEFATWAYDEGMSFNDAGIATGRSFPDALAGGAVCGHNGSVVLLADYDGGTQAVDLLAEHKDEIMRLYYLGGTASVTPELTALIESSLSD